MSSTLYSNKNFTNKFQSKSVAIKFHNTKFREIKFRTYEQLNKAEIVDPIK